MPFGGGERASQHRINRRIVDAGKRVPGDIRQIGICEELCQRGNLSRGAHHSQLPANELLESDPGIRTPQLGRQLLRDRSARRPALRFNDDSFLERDNRLSVFAEVVRAWLSRGGRRCPERK